MKYRSSRFRVRASEVAAAEKSIIAFVSKVADEPGTLRYESFREADGVSCDCTYRYWPGYFR